MSPAQSGLSSPSRHSSYAASIIHTYTLFPQLTSHPDYYLQAVTCYNPRHNRTTSYEPPPRSAGGLTYPIAIPCAFVSFFLIHFAAVTVLRPTWSHRGSHYSWRHLKFAPALGQHLVPTTAFALVWAPLRRHVGSTISLSCHLGVALDLLRRLGFAVALSRRLDFALALSQHLDFALVRAPKMPDHCQLGEKRDDWGVGTCEHWCSRTR